MRNLKIFKNYSKPTPLKWRKRGDFAVITAIIMNFIKPIMDSNPTMAEDVDKLIPSIISILALIFKLWTSSRVVKEDESE